jgi:predicted DsbA family dithiol-disulfide isomerase
MCIMNKRRQYPKSSRIDMCWEGQGQNSFRKKMAMSRVVFVLVAASIIPIIMFDLTSIGASTARATVSSSAVSRMLGKQMRQSSFFVQVDPNNTVTRSTGSGYMKGTFYSYPSAWWSVWFYVGPYVPGRAKQVSTVLQVVPLDPNEVGYAEIAYAWSTPAWSNLYPAGRPPLSGHVADMDIESEYIGRLPFGKINLQIGSERQNVSYSYLISEYSPEWLSIAVRGANFKILNGRMMYEGAPKLTGQIGQIDEARIREIVLQVIKDNPALIHRILNDYLRAQRQAQKEENERRQLETSFKDRITDIQIGSSPTIGPKDAKVTIFTFQDFECPHSQRGAKTLEPLLKQYAGKVRLVFKNRPLTFHQHAAAAAKAALAAHMQGRFWEYHNLLFENSRKLGEGVFLQLAKELHLDIDRFNTDRNSKTVEDQLNADIAEANENSLRSTPTLVMNGVLVTGTRSQSYFNNIMKRLLEQ